MMKHCLVVACLAGAFALAGAAPSRAQSAGSVLGGLAGGVIGGMIAGSIAAQAARQRPVVVYAPRRRTRVVRYVRPRPAYPAAGPARVQAVNASGDPFASPRSGVTVVNQAR
ncbi:MULTISPECIES: hypothetical protein [Methylobacterium]|jgi:predicted lipid-binding transport protein (Tim44 family)|uniref:hypothetical protein n=1 Tax=Methylobacterium TaxID=407 RepID=UPI0008DEDB16|nr:MULTISPECIES: hypothetical protein [Methylobacterium]MBK3396136.1 hypothetical protein [Methylobacterium ajmalii]MBK3406822.1 hypothetical protein [Methylobacterium ajmalii]MBZ6415323.1 hypothetical protein [Methylobacterium sp.]SFE81421.1 hypothetical protein SAMN04487844_10679 [Methylobacterium sp. yr596]